MSVEMDPQNRALQKYVLLSLVRAIQEFAPIVEVSSTANKTYGQRWASTS
jgi:hypothetical protein